MRLMPLVGCFCLVVFASPASSQTPHEPQPRVVMVDRNDKFIGYPSISFSRETVIIDVGSEDIAAIQVNSAGFYESDDFLKRQYYYEAPDCEGPQYLRIQDFQPLAYIIRKNDTIAYASVRRAKNIDVKSTYFSRRCQNLTDLNLNYLVAPVRFFPFDRKQFKPPFRLVVR